MKTTAVRIPVGIHGIIPATRYGIFKKHIVITVHGYQASEKHPTIRQIASLLSSRGMCVFTYTVPLAYAADILQQTAYLMYVIRYLKKSYAGARITLAGGSLGALVCAIVAGKNHGIHSLVTINGYFGSHHLRGYAFQVFLLLKLKGLWNSTIRNNLWRYISQNLIPENIRAPALVIHSIYDRVALPVQSEQLFRRLPGKKTLFMYDSVTADHELSDDRDIAVLTEKIAQFITSLDT